MELQPYDYILEYRDGKHVGYVDSLSRSINILIVEDNLFEYSLIVCQNQSLKIKETPQINCAKRISL